jgi:hypothetical protein
MEEPINISINEETKCWLESKLHQCCCNCLNHYKDMSHPRTDGATMDHQKGWVCFNPNPNFEGICFSGWPEHSVGCEAYTPKK